MVEHQAPHVGLDLQPLLEATRDRGGALVGGTVAGSPAARAGFRPGDRLVGIAGREVKGRFAEEIVLLNQLLLGLPAGEEVEAVVAREGEEKTLRVRPERRSPTCSRGAGSPWRWSSARATSRASSAARG